MTGISVARLQRLSTFGASMSSPAKHARLGAQNSPDGKPVRARVCKVGVEECQEVVKRCLKRERLLPV